MKLEKNGLVRISEDEDTIQRLQQEGYASTETEQPTKDAADKKQKETSTKQVPPEEK
ncbi:MAG: hypothetical protein RSA20_06780 [Oscillospiraceae bacterium]